MIILINGTINSGKTTVANILKQKIPRVAHIEKLRQYIEWMPIEESIPFNVKNIICITRNFLNGSLNVIISYSISNKNFHIIKQQLSDLKQPIYAFTLSPRLEIVTANRGDRQLKDWEIERIKNDYNEGFHKPDYGTIIDNSDQTPEETAELILKKIGL